MRLDPSWCWKWMVEMAGAEKVCMLNYGMDML